MLIMQAINTVNKSPIQSFAQCLKANGKLAQLMQQAELLRQINHSFHRRLHDADLVGHCQVMNWRQGCLTVRVDSAAWATRLRFLTPQLLVSLRTDLKELKEICYRVRPIEVITPHIYWEKPTLSAESAELLSAVAECVTDLRLKKALEHFVATACHNKM
jgi:hypothetical protein